MTMSDFMNGLSNAPWDNRICKDCGGTGWKAVMCCNGQECGCMGMPVDFKQCACNIKSLTDEQIMGYLTKGNIEMTKNEMIRVAMKAIEKNMDYETLKYSDYMYGKEKLTEDVWEYVEECRNIGLIAYSEKYKETLK